MGARNEFAISKALSKADVGITTTPIDLAEKSGTVLAIRMHQLPIISVAKSWKPKKNIIVNHSADILAFNGRNFEKVIELKTNTSQRNSLNYVANLYLDVFNK